ncbi:glycosyltransferase [Flavobacterium croceum]|uniref:glycosyltransferase n=1 Tax=Flavobacterium croceum TaxID=370975 RepID=UPI0024A7DD1F|nr:glycosyltransferase [Flavobacterium croceum]
MKRILYFYPENPLGNNQGNNSRVLSLLKFFKNQGYSLDFIGESTENFQQKDIELLIQKGLVNKGYLFPRFKKSKNQLSYFFKYYLPNKIFNKPEKLNEVKPGVQSFFNAIVSKNKYDIILISYASWASLVIDNKYINRSQTTLINDTHDFLTSQYQNYKDFELGNYFRNEIKNLKYFDYILTISVEEKYLFSQFIPENNVKLVPHGLPVQHNTEVNKHCDFDILYVASDNSHNVQGSHWFFTNVFPKINQNIKILVIGKIVNHLEVEAPNITKIERVEDLSQYYQNSKITICPMFSGTGLKIKVIESLSFGLPIVCTEKGVDGLINKSNNGCLVTNDSDTFAKSITQLITNEDIYRKYQLESIEFFNKNYSLDTVYNNLKIILQ